MNQRIILVNLKSLFEGRYNKDELIKFIYENSNLNLREMINTLCNNLFHV